MDLDRYAFSISRWDSTRDVKGRMPSSLVTARDSSIWESALAGAPAPSGCISNTSGGDTSSRAKKLQRASHNDGCLRKSGWDQRYLSGPPP